MGNITTSHGRSSRLFTVLACTGLALTAALFSSGLGMSSGTSTWSAPVQVASPESLWYTSDLEVGSTGIYVLSCIYNYGNGQKAQLFKSTDGGATWSDLRCPAGGGEPGMCVYSRNGTDVLIVAAGRNVFKSPDGGNTWIHLTPLEYSSGASWRFMTVCTSASFASPPEDDDIYIIGSMTDWYYHGQRSVITFTMSTDGGLTWTYPVHLWDNDRYVYNAFKYNAFPRITSDGDRLYAIYEVGTNEFGQARLVTRASDNWGVTWTDQKVLIANDGSSYALRPYSFQTLNSQRALITYEDIPSILSQAATTGHYGYYDFANMTYTPAGLVSGNDWMIGEGFSGKLVGENLEVAWIKTVDSNPLHRLTAIMYSSSTDTGLTAQPSESEPIAWIASGAQPSSSWIFGAETGGTWSAKMQNLGGMTSVTLTVTDLTYRRMMEGWTQSISFSELGAYPEGWAVSKPVQLLGGHAYKVVVKDPLGDHGAVVLFWNQFS